MNAIAIRNATKQFRKSAIQRQHTTFKSELLRWIRGEKRVQPTLFIESLRGVDLDVARGATMGLIGRNGAGKSTLLKLITGIYSPTAGTVQVSGRISALLDLGAGFHPEFSGRENIVINGIILGMSRSEVRSRMQQIIDFSELGDFIDEPVRTYSSGMYMRLAFSVATHVDPDILIIDEILAVGDEHFARKSRAKMNEFKQRGKTILLVTHDLHTVEHWCDRAAWIDAGKIRAVGRPAEVVEQYRSAVTRAEAEGAPIPCSGLAVPEVAAPPERGTTQTRPGLTTDKQHRYPTLEIRQVELLNESGQTALTLGPADSLDICINFVTNDDLQDVGFGLGIFGADGVQLYGTNTFAESIPLPSPLPRAGRIHFIIEQICLATGRYNVEVFAQDRAGIQYDLCRGLHSFTIRSNSGEVGAFRPPHHWSLEPAGRPSVAAEDQTGLEGES